MKQSFWSTNLKFLRNRRKFSQDSFAAQIGITRAKLNGHENGVSKNPPIEDLVKISDFFGISVDNLLRVNLAKLSGQELEELEAGNDSYATGTKIRILTTTVSADNKDNIELVPVKARAGYTAGYSDPEYISKLPVFNLPNLPQDRKYRMFPTTGDSMHPVPEGAFVIGEFIEDWKSLKADTPCIVITKNEGIVFKLVSKGKKEKQLSLRSLNPTYATYEVPVAEILEIWRFRSLVTDTLPEAETSTEQLARALQEIKSDVKQLLKSR